MTKEPVVERASLHWRQAWRLSHPVAERSWVAIKN